MISTGTDLVSITCYNYTGVLVPVTPMSFNDKKFKPLDSKDMETWQANPEISVATKFPVALHFASTIHKMQSRTVEKVILSLQPSVNPNLFELLLTGMPRTKKGNDIRILKTLGFPDDLNKILDEVTMPKGLKAFLGGYPNRKGKFSPDKSKEFRETEVSQKDTTPTRRARRHEDEASAPAATLRPVKRAKGSRNGASAEPQMKAEAQRPTEPMKRKRQRGAHTKKTPNKKARRVGTRRVGKKHRGDVGTRRVGTRRPDAQPVTEAPAQEEETPDETPEEIPDPATQPLDAEEAALYEAALESGGHPGEVLASNAEANLHITRGDLACMRPTQWLNDEAVNFYMATLNDRDTRDRAGPGRFPRCHFFNTFLYAKLKQAGYNGVTRWSLPMRLVYKGKDIHADCDRIIFPAGGSGK